MFAGDEAINNPEVVTAAVRADRHALLYASYRFSSTPDFDASFCLIMLASAVPAIVVAILFLAITGVSLATGVAAGPAIVWSLAVGGFFAYQKTNSRQVCKDAEKANDGVSGNSESKSSQ